MGKYMETGEVGFCPQCGTLAEVVVLPEDRLQLRVFRAALRRHGGGMRRAEECLGPWVVGLFEAAGWAVDSLQGAAPAEVAALAMEAGRVASQAEAQSMFQEGLRPVWGEEALDELKETLVELQIRLVLCAEAIGEVMDARFDLMKEAVDTVERSKVRTFGRGNVQSVNYEDTGGEYD